MSKHTPGPWEAYPCHRHGYTVFAATEAGKVCVIDAQDYEGRYGVIDDEANARLIAAAPELLEALQDAIALYGKFGAIVNDPHNPGEWITKAQEAVRRATE